MSEAAEAKKYGFTTTAVPQAKQKKSHVNSDTTTDCI